MEIDEILANNLKKLREQQHLSLGQLAEKAGLSKVTLSKLEQGGANPTINNIWKIANALDVPYTALLDSTGTTAAVIRQDTVVTQQSADGHYRLRCYYTTSAERNFEWFQMALDAGADYTSAGHKDRALEYIIMLSGTLAIETQDQRYTLGPGDAISFKASQSHRYLNTGDDTVSAMIINYYPV